MSVGFAALYIIILAGIIGFEVISRVPSILHTPLMSGSNFIHGIVVIGAIITVGYADGFWEHLFAFIAVILGTMNAVGGFIVTERMLAMFKPSQKEK